MPRLYQITIPGLSLKGDFPAVRRRLEVDAWLDAVSDSVATRRMSRRRSDAADAKDMASAA